MERLRNRFDVPQRNISFPAVDAADVGAVQIACCRKFLLRQVRSLSEFANTSSESFGDVPSETGSYQTAPSASQSTIFALAAENPKILRMLAHFPRPEGTGEV